MPFFLCGYISDSGMTRMVDQDVATGKLSIEIMPSPDNVFTNIPSNLPSELFTLLLDTSAVRIERIVSHGHSSPEGFWYDQVEHEWVMVLRGSARLAFEDESVALNPGDFVNIPAHRKHRVEWTTPDEPTIWLAVFY